MKSLKIIFALIVLLSSSCSDKKAKENLERDSYIRVATTNDPLSLDPRLVRDLSSSTVMRMLFEGLMRTAPNGEIVPAVAENVTLSSDNKTYTFHLRPTTWSDGSPITAEDFEQTWKSILSPNYPAPNAYQLYLIKGAKAVKEGLAASDTLGIKATDPLTLIVELEQPAPYFLEMTSCHFFFPVHQSIRNSIETNQGNTIIGNGPFIIDSWKRRSEFTVKKNPLYWDAQHVLLSGISLQVLDEHTALQLFNSGLLEWTGSPLSTLPQDAISTYKQQNKLQIAPGAGTHWFRLNTNKEPFNNENFRHAFALALDRKAIVEHVTQGNQLPAVGIIPPFLGFGNQKYFEDHDIEKAQKLFNQALKETNHSKEEFPSIALRYTSNDRNHKIAQAVQQQWNKAFNIEVALDGNESQVFLSKVKNGNYEISMGGWYADIQDPINFLEIFKSKDNPTNQTFWQNDKYTALLDLSSQEINREKRMATLAEAENILILGMPVIPIFHASYNYLKNNDLKGVYLSPLGFLDFKEGYIEERTH